LPWGAVMKTIENKMTRIVYPVFVAILYLIFSSNACGTCVIAVRHSGGLTIGADSLVLDEREMPSGHMCKIGKYGHFYGSFSGLSNDPQAGFDVEKIAANTIGSCKTIECAVQTFLHEVQPALIRSLSQIRIFKGEEYFVEHFIRRKPLEILIYGAQEGSSTIHQIIISVKNERRPLELSPPDDDKCPGNCPYGEVVYGAGCSEVATSVMQTAFYSHFPKGRIPTVLQALRDDTNALPRLIGPPFSIAELNNAGSIRLVDPYQGVCRASLDTPKGSSVNGHSEAAKKKKPNR
jgi:hypothetical protein